MADPLARETRKLYGLPPSEFTAARNTRAKELRKDDPELAAAVAALPKPSVALTLQSPMQSKTLPGRDAARRFLPSWQVPLPF